MSATPDRPTVVETAFWVLLVGAVLLIVGGLLAATLSFDVVRQLASPSISDEQLRAYLVFHRSVGVLFALSGGALAFLAGKARRGDVRYRRATIGLGVAAVVMVTVLTLFAQTGVLPMVALLPIVGGLVLITRPAATAWFTTGEQR